MKSDGLNFSWPSMQIMRGIFYRLGKTLWTRSNEYWYGISTMPSAQDSEDRLRKSRGKEWWLSKDLKGVHPDSLYYASPDYHYLRRIRRVISPTERDTVYDIGCGMGRILCVFARLRLNRCVGVELSSELCEVARANANRMLWKRTRIDIINADAAVTDMSDGTVFIMYNPFGRETMVDVLKNLSCSPKIRHQGLRIVYYKDVHRELLESQRWLEEADHFSTLNGVHISIWKSKMH